MGLPPTHGYSLPRERPFYLAEGSANHPKFLLRAVRPSGESQESKQQARSSRSGYDFANDFSFQLSSYRFRFVRGNNRHHPDSHVEDLVHFGQRNFPVSLQNIENG